MFVFVTDSITGAKRVGLCVCVCVCVYVRERVLDNVISGRKFVCSRMRHYSILL